MAQVFFVKNAASNIEHRVEKNVEKTVRELTSILEGYTVKFQTNSENEVPVFNDESRSDLVNFRGYQYVVIKITSKDELNDKFREIGFYLVEDINPREFTSLS